jgi:hypothetical protein
VLPVRGISQNEVVDIGYGRYVAIIFCSVALLNLLEFGVPLLDDLETLGEAKLSLNEILLVQNHPDSEGTFSREDWGGL